MAWDPRRTPEGELPGSALDAVIAYHERTKHHPHRYARSLGYLDWATRPDPFRTYAPAPLHLLDELEPGPDDPSYDRLLEGTAPVSAPAPLDRHLVSQLLYDSLALSAWKAAGGDAWSLRCDPSSGNLHPTEAHLVAPAIAGLSEAPCVYHYAPLAHALEARRTLTLPEHAALTEGLPEGTLLLAFSSIPWREAWKYGERAFRYCQHDVGHALAAVILAAGALGWRVRLLDGVDDVALTRLLGFGDEAAPEAEHADGLLALTPAAGALPWADRYRLPPAIVEVLAATPQEGAPNRLSDAHHPWPVLDTIARATRHPGRVAARPDGAIADGLVVALEGAAPPRDAGFRRLARTRRSAVAMDGVSTLERSVLYRLLATLLPRRGHIVFDGLPWPAHVHLILFVHRVRDLAPGLYVLARGTGALEALRHALQIPGALWGRPPECPEELPLRSLALGDMRATARAVSCGQEIASDGAFAVALLAELEPVLMADGASFYRRLHWEAGAIGQLLYLGAEAAGLRGTGIGCFFDDEVHRLLGIAGRRYQTLYHFTVGGPVEDTRLTTLAAYAHRPRLIETERLRRPVHD